ncbi:MAG TPA: phage holin family protein [Bryobacteraceae bacterium]|nr:phage holin family protein [Bryobacteraceae bacterium]
MLNLLLHWIASAGALLVVAYFIPGVSVDGFKTALIAAAVIGLINVTLGNVIKFFAWPARVLTLGLASLVINALMLLLVANLVTGFRVSGFWAAFFGSIVLGVVSAIFGALVPEGDGRG